MIVTDMAVGEGIEIAGGRGPVQMCTCVTIMVLHVFISKMCKLYNACMVSIVIMVSMTCIGYTPRVRLLNH